VTSDGPRPDDGDGRYDRRSARKRQAILDAATEVFLRNGYLGASMDAAAARAGVSKQTVYKHFADKKRLFSAVVTQAVAAAGNPVHEQVLNLGSDSADLDAELRGVARQLLHRVMHPEILQLRRLVIGEAGRFPELGRIFYEQGHGRTVAALATAFERLHAQGRLQAGDAPRAAAHFTWLVLSIPLNRAMLLGDDQPPQSTDIDRYADDAVDAFLGAYGGPRRTVH
jgi:TetR/AcrR family transcriptional regulator, mexJK operon transcriptional repressor